MRRSTTLTATVLGSACLVATLAGCSLPSIPGLQQVPSVEDARAARRSALKQTVADSDLATPGVLTVGIKGGQTAPLSITGNDGKITGIDVDTARALADKLGIPEVHIVSVTGAAAGIEDKCDVVMDCVTAEDPSVVVVGDYAQTALGVFTVKGPKAPIAASDMAKATVGVQAGSVSQGAAAQVVPTATLSTYANLNDAFDALNSGTVTYVVCDAYAGAYLAGLYSDVTFAGTLDRPTSLGVAVSAKNTNLQNAVRSALDDLRHEGISDVVRAPWVGSLPDLTDATRLSGIK